jgi:hypothetical protein
MFGFPAPSSLPCPECGAVIALDGDGHECDAERRRWHQLFLVNSEVESLEQEFREYLSSARGRFEAFYAERERLLRAA